MKAFTLPLIALISLLVLGSAGTATAQAPVQNLKTTAQYKSLKTFVNTLRARSSTPTTAERKRSFRTQLGNKRNKANAKAKSIFNLTINQIKKKDDVQERQQIKRIRQNQKAQVTALKSSLGAQLRNIAANERIATNRINERYANRINPLSRERSTLKRRLAVTKKQAQRNALIRKINAIQEELNSLVNARQSALNAVDTRFDSRSDAASNLTATKVQRAKAAAKRQIMQARRAWKNLFREEFADAKEKRSDNFESISELHTDGLGYIQQMPLRTN